MLRLQVAQPPKPFLEPENVDFEKEIVAPAQFKENPFRDELQRKLIAKRNEILKQKKKAKSFKRWSDRQRQREHGFNIVQGGRCK